VISRGPLNRTPAGEHLKARLLAAILVALAAIPAAERPVDAEPLPQPTYVEAARHALNLIQGASPPDTAPARAALQVLIDETGVSQPEILADLRARPPLYEDARQRLSALIALLDQPADTSDPALAQQRLHDVMSMSRYDPLHRPPSLLDRIQQWVQDRISDLLRLLFGNGSGAQPPALWLYAIGIAVLLGMVVLIARAARGRFSQGLGAPTDRPRPPADYFAEADRLAASGERVGAIRALCAAVAATLAGEGSWAGSPLTVREIFQRAPDHASLRPLLVPFEAAVYGGREVDAATYERAAAVAAAFRVKEEAAA
jgi:hypothetical protein